MKFIHLLPVLASAAALGAFLPSTGSGSAHEGGTAARLPVNPPWLTRAWEGAPEELTGDPHAVDPHAGGLQVSDAYAADPHAEVCSGLGVLAEDGSDPHAQLCAGNDPHEDPHAGMYAAGDTDPHAELYADEPQATDVAYEYEAARIDRPATPVEASKAANGKKVADVFAERTSLDQKTIRVRAVVVKLMEGILGKTYLHLQDGSGSAGTDDLTVTTTEAFSLGETVEVEGRLAIDQDIGVGYSYAALLTDATRITR